MNADRRAAVYTGVLFIIATVAAVIGTTISGPALTGADYLAKLPAHAGQVTGGALLSFIGAAACPAIAIAMYPVLKRWHSGLALGAVAFRTAEAVLYFVGIVSLLALVVISKQFASATPTEQVALQTAGKLLFAVRDQASPPAVLAFCLGALMYYYILYESRLIPRWLSIWGLVAILMAIGASVTAWLSQTNVTSYVIVMLPIAVQEMVLAIWLIAKGFSASALRSRTLAGNRLAA